MYPLNTENSPEEAVYTDQEWDAELLRQFPQVGKTYSAGFQVYGITWTYQNAAAWRLLRETIPPDEYERLWIAVVAEVGVFATKEPPPGALENDDEPALKHLQGQHDQATHGRGGGKGAVRAPHEPIEIPEKLQPVLRAYMDESIGLTEFQKRAAMHGLRSGMSSDPADIGYKTEMNEIQLYGAAVARRAKDMKAHEERSAEFTESQMARVKGEVDAWLESGTVMIKVSSHDLQSILDSGEVRNQFQTQTSGGLLHNDTRAVNEAAHHGIDVKAGAAQRPIYGFVGGVDTHPESTVGYGDVTLVLRDSVADRTTVTLGDSLNTFAQPMPMRGDRSPRDVLNASDISSDDVYRDIAYGASPFDDGVAYMEAQIHGGVKRSDIRSIVFDGTAAREYVDRLRGQLGPEGIDVEVNEDAAVW